MTTRHPDARALARYVMGALDADEIGRIDRHVRACAACASALCAEARAETRLRSVLVALDDRAVAKVVSLPRRSMPARRPFLGNALAAAAALVLAWGLAERGPRGRVGGSAAALGADGALVCELAADEPLCRWPARIARQSLLSSVDHAVDRSYDGDVCRQPTGGVCRLSDVP